MRVLLIHNRYRTSAPSGEDAAVRNEQRMLEKNGIEVVSFDRCNDDIDDSNMLNRAATAANSIWSFRTRNALNRTIQRFRPNIAHVHNTFAIMSPGIYGICRAQGVPVVQTLHNYRFFCPGALMLRDGKPCERCLERSLWQSLKYRCYRGSLSATTTLAAMLALHRSLGTYSRGIDRYVALTEFAKRKFVMGGIPAEKILVKPNFVPGRPAVGTGSGGYVAYVGRLLEGKGTETLMTAWRSLPHIKLKIVGDGALRASLEATARREQLNVEFMGMLDRDAVLQTVRQASLLVVPSEWYEGFPMVIAESFACGTPVLASRIGSLDELVEEGVRGAKFTAGRPQELAAAASSMMADHVGLKRMRVQARAYFDEHLTERQNQLQLRQIYSDVIGASAKSRAARRSG